LKNVGKRTFGKLIIAAAADLKNC